MIKEILRPSPNHSERDMPISCIVIHDTASRTAASALDWFSRPESKVSAHVVIDRNGDVYRCVEDGRKAWHAGRSSLHGELDVNEFSLGVELVDADDSSGDPYPPAQLAAAAEWCARACEKYVIPLNRVVGHVDVSPNRKHDPGPDFPWAKWLHEVALHIGEVR